jgi:hypothetical protein
MELACGAAPARVRIALDDGDFQTARGERHRRGQSVRARADDACVVSQLPPPPTPLSLSRAWNAVNATSPYARQDRREEKGRKRFSQPFPPLVNYSLVEHLTMRSARFEAD